MVYKILNTIEKVKATKIQIKKVTITINIILNTFKSINMKDQKTIDEKLDRLSVIYKEKKRLDIKEQKLESELKQQLSILKAIKNPTNEDLDMIKTIEVVVLVGN